MFVSLSAASRTGLWFWLEKKRGGQRCGGARGMEMEERQEEDKEEEEERKMYFGLRSHKQR